MDTPITELRRKEPVTPSTTTQGVDNKKSVFPYAASAISNFDQNIVSIFERHCIKCPGLLVDTLFKGYDLKTILSFRVISKTVCEFINLRSFLGMRTSISFWYELLFLTNRESIPEDQQKMILKITSMIEAKQVLKLLGSGLYDKRLIDGIQTIDLSQYAFSHDVGFLMEMLRAICQNLPTNLEEICIGAMWKRADSSSFTFTPPKELLKKITKFSILGNQGVVDLQEADGLEMLNIENVRGKFILPKAMNKLKTICVKEINVDLYLPMEAQHLVNLHIKQTRCKSKVILPGSLNKLENLRFENIEGNGIDNLPNSFPNLMWLFIGSVQKLDVSGSFPKLKTLHIDCFYAFSPGDFYFSEPEPNNLILPDSLPSLVEFSIDYVNYAHFILPKVNKLKKLFIGSVHSYGSFQVTSELNDLEDLIIKRVDGDNIKLTTMLNLKKFIIEDMSRYARFEFPGTIDTLRAIDTNVLDNKKFELEASSKNTTYILLRNR